MEPGADAVTANVEPPPEQADRATDQVAEQATDRSTDQAVEQAPDQVVDPDGELDLEVPVSAADLEVTEFGGVEVGLAEVEVDSLEGPGEELDSPEPDLSVGQGYEVLLTAAEQVLDDVDAALARLRDGSYGTCEVCGDAIADDLLSMLPTARSCERHLPLPAAS